MIGLGAQGRVSSAGYTQALDLLNALAPKDARVAVLEELRAEALKYERVKSEAEGIAKRERALAEREALVADREARVEKAREELRGLLAEIEALDG